MPEVTKSVSAPRIAAIEYPLGRNLGSPGDSAGQSAVLHATFDALLSLEKPGDIVDLPFKWPEDPKNVHCHPDDPPPIAKAIMRRPWLFRTLAAGNIPQNS